MSTSNPVPRLNLEVRCADSATEVFVIDGQFNLKTRGIGHLKAELEPGIYKVKVRAGFETQEQAVILRDHDETIDIPRFNFVSPAPLNDTSKTHEFHMQAAYDGSRQVHLKAGQGSSIFIFVRDWTGDTRPAQVEPSYPNPGRDLSLHDRQGAPIVDLTTQGKHSDQWEPWVACNVEVNPGSYLLNLKTPAGEILEQTIVAAPGWQTQVFLLQRDYGDRPDGRRADVQGAAILMAPLGTGFDPNSPSLRFGELARLGLANGRRVLSDDVRQMLNEKFQNPMMGILGAHLLLLDAEPDLNLLNIVINNLRGLLSAPHPDVEALALKINPDSSHSFDMPPMVRKSWTMIVGATATGLDLIPDNSKAATIATRVWGTDPWLIWNRQTESVSEKLLAHESGHESAPAIFALSNVDAILQSSLAEIGKRVMRGAKLSVDSPFAAISKMKATRNQDQPRKRVMRSASIFSGDKDSKDPEAAAPEINEDKIQTLVHSLNIPRKNLERMIANLTSNLTGSGDDS